MAKRSGDDAIGAASAANGGTSNGTRHANGTTGRLSEKECREARIQYFGSAIATDDEVVEPERKRARTDDAPPGEGVRAKFSDDLWQLEEHYTSAYKTSGPYRHSVIRQLFQDSLLRRVKAEIDAELVFSEKETDIYKVNQTGDLANLDGLPAHEAAKLKNLRLLRDSLYSEDFRKYVERVTGVGPLSGRKIDMSINDYRRGCHLLNHDDVIGSRSVSYILYLPTPVDWRAEYGGALELYPVVSEGVPADEPSLIIPPSWDQFIMFAVQPGHSFHSVEEVVHPTASRLSISGWFHVAQEGEPGYSPDAQRSAQREEDKVKSTLQQLMDEDDEDLIPVDQLPDVERNQRGLIRHDAWDASEDPSEHADRLADDGFIASSGFLIDDVPGEKKVELLFDGLRAIDARDGLVPGSMPKHGTGVDDAWECRGPPHRQRYLKLRDEFASPSEGGPPITFAIDTLSLMRAHLLSKRWTRWLERISGCKIVSARASVRRFRPGLDYTLATSSRKRMLEVCVCLTPDPALPYANQRGSPSIDGAAWPEASLWEGGEYGGYSVYMEGEDDDDDDEQDAAVYRAGEDDGVLLKTHPAFDSFSLVLVDPGVLTFTKYISATAGASRFDVFAQYVVEDEDELEVESGGEGEGEDGEQIDA